MTNAQEVQPVAITDIHMPFWSMVTFMLKWAIAAIPAAIMLVAIVMGSMAIFSGLIATIERVKTSGEQTTYRSSTSTSGLEIQKSNSAPQPGYASDVPDRCKGSVELEKCVEFERKLASETPEQKKERQARLMGK
jgi:hypothetical protein